LLINLVASGFIKVVKRKKILLIILKCLYFLSEIGKKMGYEVYIGKREQPEIYNGKKLSDYADITKLDKLNFDQDKKSRIEMIDMVWINNNKVEFAIEVENSTNFTSGIQRHRILMRK